MQPMTVNGGATVTLEDCVFSDNLVAIRNDTSEYFEFEEATIAQPQDTIIRLQHCTFLDSYYAVELTANLSSENQPYGEVLVISDPHDDKLIVSYQVIYENDDYGGYTENSTSNEWTVPAKRRGIGSTSSWFQRVQKVRLLFTSPIATFIDIA
jgi:hypothetical protein